MIYFFSYDQTFLLCKSSKLVCLSIRIFIFRLHSLLYSLKLLSFHILFLLKLHCSLFLIFHSFPYFFQLIFSLIFFIIFKFIFVIIIIIVIFRFLLLLSRTRSLTFNPGIFQVLLDFLFHALRAQLFLLIKFDSLLESCQVFVIVSIKIDFLSVL